MGGPSVQPLCSTDTGGGMNMAPNTIDQGSGGGGGSGDNSGGGSSNGGGSSGGGSSSNTPSHEPSGYNGFSHEVHRYRYFPSDTSPDHHSHFIFEDPSIRGGGFYYHFYRHHHGGTAPGDFIGIRG